MIFSGSFGIQTQNVTNMCLAIRNLCLNGRCIPLPGNNYRCECNMGFKLDIRGECIGMCLIEWVKPPENVTGGTRRWRIFYRLLFQMKMNVKETLAHMENVSTLKGRTSVSVLLDSKPLRPGQSAEVSSTPAHTRTNTLMGYSVCMFTPLSVCFSQIWMSV